MQVPFEALKREARERKGLVEKITNLTQDIALAAESAASSDGVATAKLLTQFRDRVQEVIQDVRSLDSLFFRRRIFNAFHIYIIYDAFLCFGLQTLKLIVSMQQHPLRIHLVNLQR